MRTNRKVINATPGELDGIVFKSLLERRAYRLYKEAGLEPSYEPEKIVLVEGFRPTTPFYAPCGKPKRLGLNARKVLDCTYTPDIVIKKGGITYYVELKGFRTDSYEIKVKLFRKWLEDQPSRVFLELHSVGDVRESIRIINGREGNKGDAGQVAGQGRGNS